MSSITKKEFILKVLSSLPNCHRVKHNEIATKGEIFRVLIGGTYLNNSWDCKDYIRLVVHDQYISNEKNSFYFNFSLYDIVNTSSEEEHNINHIKAILFCCIRSSCTAETLISSFLGVDLTKLKALYIDSVTYLKQLYNEAVNTSKEIHDMVLSNRLLNGTQKTIFNQGSRYTDTIYDNKTLLEYIKYTESKDRSISNIEVNGVLLVNPVSSNSEEWKDKYKE